MLIAALVSVPAIFLTTVGDSRWALLGHTLNWASLAVLGAETLLLFLVSGDRWRWVRRYKWHLLITAAAVPAVIFALFPAQAMRLLHLARLVGTLRVRRATRIIRSGRLVATRLGLTGVWWHLLVGVGATLAVGFVVVVLADPEAWGRYRTIMRELGRGGISLVLAVVAALVLVGLGILIAHRSRSGTNEAGEELPRPYAESTGEDQPDEPRQASQSDKPGQASQPDEPRQASQPDKPGAERDHGDG